LAKHLAEEPISPAYDIRKNINLTSPSDRSENTAWLGWVPGFSVRMMRGMRIPAKTKQAKDLRRNDA
jgi:hypothetical protein